MTLDNLEHENKSLYGFFWQFWAATRIAPTSLEVNQDNLVAKFSAFNADFNGLSIDPLCSRRPAHEDIKEGYPFKMHVFGLSNGSKCAIPVTPSNECRFKTINTGLFIIIVSNVDC